MQNPKCIGSIEGINKWKDWRHRMVWAQVLDQVETHRADQSTHERCRSWCIEKQEKVELATGHIIFLKLQIKERIKKNSN